MSLVNIISLILDLYTSPFCRNPDISESRQELLHGDVVLVELTFFPSTHHTAWLRLSHSIQRSAFIHQTLEEHLSRTRHFSRKEMQLHQTRPPFKEFTIIGKTGCKCTNDCVKCDNGSEYVIRRQHGGGSGEEATEEGNFWAAFQRWIVCESNYRGKEHSMQKE